MPKVTIYTQAYNSGNYLEQCIESVLNQTYTDFEWILIDHGSTDNTRSVIESYAERDKRIIPIHVDVNNLFSTLFYDSLKKSGTGKYLTWLDSDDWWDSNYLEELVPFAEENDLDLAITGVIEYFQQYGTSRVMRRLKSPIGMTVEEFAHNYSLIGPFAGALWANLRPLEKVLSQEADPRISEIREKRLNWRSDTLYMLAYIDSCQRIGINEFAPYHYRRYDGSLSGQYSNTYFESNIIFHQRLQDFLYRHGALNEDALVYLKRRYLTEVRSTFSVLQNSDLSGKEKLQECAKIAKHPLTASALTHNCEEKNKWWLAILNFFIAGFRKGQVQDPNVAKDALGELVPQCANMLSEEGLEFLFWKQKELLPIFSADDWRTMCHQILAMLEKNQFNKKYNLLNLFQGLLPDEIPLSRIQDPHFFKRHAGITSLVLDENYHQALEEMTGELLQKEKLYAEEDFLQLYLTLAALENEVSAFLFGKVRLAKLYQHERRLTECRALLAELEEMGAEFPEMDVLKAACDGEAPS